MQNLGRIALACILAAGLAALPVGAAYAADLGPASELSPDVRPVLVLQAPQGPLLLVHPAASQRDHHERRAPLPAAWQTGEADRGFTQALLMPLSHVGANWPWRSLIISTSAPESDSQLQSLTDQDAVVAVVADELVDLGGRVQFQLAVDLATVHAIATAREKRVLTHVRYLAQALLGDSRLPRRNLAAFAMDQALDEQVSTAATDLSQFLATVVARLSVPSSLRPHNPTLGGLGLHLACTECRASDRVIYRQPGRVWVKLGAASGGILALPLPTPATSQPTGQGGRAAQTDRP